MSLSTRARKGMNHACVKALCDSGVSLEQAEGCIGNFIRAYCLVSHSCDQNTSKKCLKSTQKTSGRTQTAQNTVMTEESPDITHMPTVNTLVCYYSHNQRQKQIFLTDVARLNTCNSFTLCNVAIDAVRKAGKARHDAIVVSSKLPECQENGKWIPMHLRWQKLSMCATCHIFI